MNENLFRAAGGLAIVGLIVVGLSVLVSSPRDTDTIITVAVIISGLAAVVSVVVTFLEIRHQNRKRDR